MKTKLTTAEDGLARWLEQARTRTSRLGPLQPGSDGYHEDRFDRRVVALADAGGLSVAKFRESIGFPGYFTIRCDGCGGLYDRIAWLGEEPNRPAINHDGEPEIERWEDPSDYMTHTMHICRACLLAAVVASEAELPLARHVRGSTDGTDPV